MSRTSSRPNKIIYDKRGQIYNAICETCFILAILFLISVFVGDIIIGHSYSHWSMIFAIVALGFDIIALIFSYLSSKHGTIIFL
jgi:uncharacterized membrane protein